MTQASQDPQAFYDNEDPTTFLTQVGYTNLNKEFGQVYRSSMIKQRINFYKYSSFTWYDHLPIINFFKKLTVMIKESDYVPDDDDFDLITFRHEIE